MPHKTRIVHALAISLIFVGAARAQQSDPQPSPLFRIHGQDGPSLLLRHDASDRPGMRQPMTTHRFGMPVAASRELPLVVSTMTVVTADTRVEIGADARPIVVDWSRLVLLRGGVDGIAGSRVFLAFSDQVSNGYISLPNGERWGISSRDQDGRPLGQGIVAVHAVRPGGASLPGVPMCGLDTTPLSLPFDGDQGGPTGDEPFEQRGVSLPMGPRRIDMAIETDYEFYVLFNNATAAATYVAQLYAAIGDIYLRDVGANITLTFVRLWDNPNDMFNDLDPLSGFRAFWNANMQSVPRDTAQFLSGRRNLPAGGVAYLPGLCNSNAYSWSGYTLGYFSDPAVPSSYTRDIIIAGHELGHNCNTPHTQDLGLDTCHLETTPPRRGTIMSYCGQTFTGGDSNHDLWFHTACQTRIEAYLAAAPCIAVDCNENGTADNIDISAGTSPDVNLDEIPDECQDCNTNTTLDTLDISSGGSLDRNSDIIPDECQPDCNANGTIDVLDFDERRQTILSDNFEQNLGWTVVNLGATGGQWERGIPVNDPNNSFDPTSDYDGSGSCWLTQNAFGNTDVDNGATQLVSPRLDLSAGGVSIGYAYFLRLSNTNGVDRLLVEGNDADGAGTWRTLATHTTNGLSWRTSLISPAMISSAGLTQTALFRVRFTINDGDPQSTVEGAIDAFYLTRIFPPLSRDFNADGIPDECQGDCDDNNVLDYEEIVADMSRDLNRNVVLDSCEDCDADGTRDLVELDHSHNIWVAALDQGTLREYLANYGTQTATSADLGPGQAQDLIITADRRILVSLLTENRVVEVAQSGAFVRTLVTPGDGGLSQPGAMLVSPWNSLLVASAGTNSIIEYDLATGMHLGAFVAPGAGGLLQPFGIAFGPNGNLFVTSADNQVFEFDGDSGAFVQVFVSADDNGGLDEPHGIMWLRDRNVLLVASTGTDRIIEYSGVTGAYLRQFSQVGTADVLTFDQPWCIREGPDGGVYSSRSHVHDLPPPTPGPGPAPLHLSNARIYHFDRNNGYFVRSFIMGVNSGLENPTGFDFVPDAGTDCNNNQQPDNCDISAGISFDLNLNSVPDECDCRGCPGDMTADRRRDGDDVNGYVQALLAELPHPCLDMNGDHVVNVADAQLFAQLLVAGVDCP